MRLVVQTAGHSRVEVRARTIQIVIAKESLVRGEVPLALAHELGHTATLTKRKVAQGYSPWDLYSGRTQAVELMAWVWAFSKKGNRRGVREAARALKTYDVPHAYATLSALLDRVGVPRGRGA